MRGFYHICIGLTIGVIAGFIAGGIRFIFGRKVYSEARINATKKFVNAAAGVLKYLTFLLLALGVVWCVYFLILGIANPAQADYANNMAELIVSVLTVISIIFAFVEFLRRKDEKK